MECNIPRHSFLLCKIEAFGLRSLRFFSAVKSYSVNTGFAILWVERLAAVTTRFRALTVANWAEVSQLGIRKFIGVHQYSSSA